MIELEEAKIRLRSMKEDAADLGLALKIEKLQEDARELEEKTFAPDFWDNQENSGKVLKELKKAQDTVAAYNKLCSDINDDYDLAEMANEEGDASMVETVLSEEQRLKVQMDEMRIATLLSGQYDKNNAILALHPGAGGTEAQDWALMLYRMYTRWAEKHGFNVKLVDWLDGDEAGIKSATIVIEGENAYGYLKSEHGVHRLVRISPFDASGRRHTSFASCEVTPEIEDDDSIEIREEDIEVTTHKSSGAGGQHINKTESAVRIVHKPTGIVVGCQTERSQGQNKEYALKMLRSKLAEIKRRETMEKMDGIRGEKANIEWGSQIRSYVFMPYTLVKDQRTEFETADVSAVMDGELDGFINAYLRMITK